MKRPEYSDIHLLPYWFAGRVADSTHVEAFDLMGNEDAMMREMLMAEAIRDHVPITRRELAALIFDDAPGTSEEVLPPAVSLSARGEIESWIRETWRFVPAAAAGDDLEQIVLTQSREEIGAVGVGTVWRIGPGDARDRLYVCVLESHIAEQDGLWHGVRGALFDGAGNRPELRKAAENPLFESIRQGWDWPVYYRDMVANSQLIWSASGEDIDLRALAESQPHDS